MSRRNCGPVPNRWMNCPRKGSSLIVGQFMAFKTPLNYKFDGIVPQECRFPPKMLFDLCKTKKVCLIFIFVNEKISVIDFYR